MDETDRLIINRLQAGFPLSERPYAEAAHELGITEEVLIERLRGLLGDGILSRFGPMYDAEKLGGGLTLAALKVPAEAFDRVAGILDSLPEIAHNYERDHEFNMWFVIAAESPGRIPEIIELIEDRTGLEVLNLPKLDEFYVGLRLEA